MTMNHKLALSLKDAGFPQRFKNGNHFFEGFEKTAPTKDSVVKPTLEELIAACGEGRMELRRENKRWFVDFKLPNPGEAYTDKQGSKDLIVALARLWLSLNKK